MLTSPLQSTHRFSNRVGWYVQARPKYPAALLDFLQSDLGLRPEHRIADMGSGTGLLAEMFLRNGNSVIGIEPNSEMRAAGDEILRNYSHFKSIDATAERTSLPDHSIDLVMAGQAFHWFDVPKVRAEFQRILVPGGRVVLVWNERRVADSGFDAAYDELIRRFATDVHVDHHTQVTGVADEVLGAFFGPGHFRVKCFDNFQELNLEGVKARLLSSSYMPLPDHLSFPDLMREAERAFHNHAIDGAVRIAYDTRAYYGTMS